MEEARPTDVVRIEVEGSLGGYVGMKVVPVQGRVGVPSDAFLAVVTLLVKTLCPLRRTWRCL